MDVLRLLAPAVAPGVLGWGSVAIGVAIFLWTSPVSPVALWRADVLLGQGRAHDATALYDAIAATNPIPGVRARALDRSALTWSVELGQPTEARVRLEELLYHRMSRAEQAEVLDRVGQLLLLEGQPLDAAVRLREAHDIAKELPTAPARLARAARAASLGNDLELSARMWRRMGQDHPSELARAELGLANVALTRGDVEEALASYQAAAAHAVDAEIASAARLGAATCLERLGDLDQALAALDSADLPPAVFESRAARIRAREALR
jgi:tetratricopeptide (TPR) repeat protein